jgi:hypothetical protein
MASARYEIKGTYFARISTPSFPSRLLKFWELFMEFMHMAHRALAHGGNGPPKLILTNLLPTSPSLAGHNGSKHSWSQWVHGTFRCSYLIRASPILPSKPSDTQQKGWKAFKYSSLWCEALVNTLYFLFILSPSSCTLRLSLGPRSNFWWDLVIHLSWRSL